MSILPSRDLGSASSSSSSQAPFLNPNSNHGLHFLPQRQPPIPTSELRPQSSPDCEPQFLQSLQISNSVDTSYDVSGTLAPAAESTSGTSKKVKESSECIGKNFVARQHNGKNFRCGAGTAQYREKPAEVVSSHIQQNSGRVNCQASSTHTAGRKPQMVNGNHLLNFHYDPISRPLSRVAPPLRRHQKRKPYNKDLFLQANYKFVVLDSGNHAPEMLDPDKLLMWEDIVCLKFSTPLPVKCPICLDDPLCPQITSCGHIFCFPCILRYFLNSEYDRKGEIWKKCPLCFVMISSKDLYTIYIENVKQHSVGDTAEFMLLTRQKDSLTLSLKNKESIGTDEEAPDSYSKFTFTSDVDLSVRNAVSDLDSWLARADSGLVDDLEKLPYVCAAMEQLEQRRKYWNERRVGHEKARESPPSADYANVHHDPGKWGSLSISGNVKLKLVGDTSSDNVDGGASLDRSVDVVEPAEGVEGAMSSLCKENNIMKNNFDGFRVGNEKDSYNFYQWFQINSVPVLKSMEPRTELRTIVPSFLEPVLTPGSLVEPDQPNEGQIGLVLGAFVHPYEEAIDGQHLILHPLNMKCLLHHYGNYDKLPHRRLFIVVSEIKQGYQVGGDFPSIF